MKKPKIYPPTWLLLALIAMPLVSFLLPIRVIIPDGWNLLGIVFIILGVVINLLADQAFHQANTTVTPFDESTALLTNGVFRMTRNPMYLGFTLLLAGVALLLKTLTPWWVVIAFIILIDRRFIIFEEQMLSTKFGEKYADYRRRTGRWL